MKHKIFIGLGIIGILLLLMGVCPDILAQLLTLIIVTLLVVGAIIILWGPFKMILFIVGGIFSIFVFIGVIGSIMTML